MKILFDHQIFGIQNFGGISRYFFEVASKLAELEGVKSILPFPFSNNGYLVQPGPLRKSTFFSDHRIKGKHHALRMINRLSTSIALRRGNYQVFHPTFFDPFFLEPLGRKPFVLTVYDMIHEIFPEYYDTRDKTAEWKKVLMHKASAIIAISNHTKQDILRFHDIDERKIRVIYLSDSFHAGFSSEQVLGLPFRYFLFVGSRIRYKNFQSMVRGLAPLLTRDPTLHVVCVGGDEFNSAEKELFSGLGLEGRFIFKSVDDSRLAYIYEKALALIFPSLYEGFGIPILEAFRSRCPAILAKSSCFPEIAVDAALFFNPGDPDDLAFAAARLLAEPALRADLIEKGRARAADFSWDKTALETLEVYRSVAG